MKVSSLSISGPTITGLLLAASCVAAEDNPPLQLTEIQQQAPGFLVHAAVNRESRDYREGDSFSMRVVSERDAYLYVIYQQADGRAYQVYPNVAQQENHVKAKQVITIPAADDPFRWRIAPPFGTETVKVIASERPLEKLSDEQMRSKRYNPVSPDQLKALGDRLAGIDAGRVTDKEHGNAPNWAETELTVTTYPINHQLEASGKKRYAVFFGVSEYEFDAQVKLASKGGLNLASPHRDAQILDQILQDVGDVDESRVFINEQATRRNLELALTHWLPQRSAPGDTVLIYFSGHGGQLPDDNGDEADKLDEFLLPHDFLGLSGLVGLIKQQEAGTLPSKYQELIPRAKQLVAQAGSMEKADEKLSRLSGITDDLFGHWLQSLSDRQVVVILDICHAGGFSNAEKAVTAIDNAQPAVQRFEFLDGELSRLKDIGQDNTALLTSSATAEVSLVRPDGVLSVMTHELAVALRNARGPLDIDQAYAKVKSQCEAYFASDEFHRRNEGRDEPVKPHHPLLYKSGDQRVWLKP